MSEAHGRGSDGESAEPDSSPASEPDASSAAAGSSVSSASMGDRLGGGLAKAVRAGSEGEAVSASGVIAAVGGWRGVIEAVLPALIFVVMFVATNDARLSALVPGALAILLLLVRLVRRETLISAFSGIFGVGVAVIITLVTGRGVDYFLSGFIVNIVWGAGLLVSLLIGWPVLGFIVGMLRGDLTGWRRELPTRRIASLVTLLWLALFIARLAVQVPMYLAGDVAALGIARIVMGIPMFALLVVVTWLLMRRHASSSDDESAEIVDTTGEDAQSV